MKDYDNGELKDSITPEEAKEQFNIINQPSKNYSQAANSEIKSVEQDQADAKSVLMQMINDQRQQREEIDKLNQSVQYIADKMAQIAQVVDKQSQVLNQINPNAVVQPQSPESQMDKLAGLGDLVEKAGPLLDRMFPKNEAAPPLIDNNTIQEKMKQTFFDNLETGESINNFIKNSLKKSVTKTVINSSLKDIGEAARHEPA